MSDASFERFDILIVGTSLVSSCVAAAAAIAGKRVLHVDSAPFYGGADATLPLRDFDAWMRAGGGAGVHYLGGGGSVSAVEAVSGSNRSGRTYIDVFPSLTLARGGSVDDIVSAGAAGNLEFRAIEGAFVSDEQCGFMRVPAGKRDIFDDPNLSLLERRALGRFLQAVADDVEAANHTAAALTTLNERGLGIGRSLRRPQNKPAASAATAHVGGGSSGDGGISTPSHAGAAGSWAAALTAAGLSARLSTLIRAAIALEADGMRPLSSEEGKARAAAYASAVSRFGGGAFLMPLYGSGELPQALCRVAAVHGAVYALGVRVAQWELISPADAGAREETAAAGAAAACLRLRVDGFPAPVTASAAFAPQGLAPPELCRSLDAEPDAAGGARVSVVVALVATAYARGLEQCALSVATLPPTAALRGATLVQQGPSTCVVSSGLVCAHVFATARAEDPADVAQARAELLCRAGLLWELDDSAAAAAAAGGARVLWHMAYSIQRAGGGAGGPAGGSEARRPVVLAPAPPADCLWRDCNLHNEGAFAAARRAFSALFPDSQYFVKPEPAASGEPPEVRESQEPHAAALEGGDCDAPAPAHEANSVAALLAALAEDD
jgi:hypothetical protein